MTKSLVTRGLGFLGFELCIALLEEGEGVLAVDREKEAGERWMEVGRNSNISYQPLNKAGSEDISASFIYINLYDELTEEKSTDEVFSSVKELIEKNKDGNAEAVVLLPTVLSDRKSEDSLNRFLEDMKGLPIKNSSRIYIPTLIGPGQPESFLFQQLLTGKESESKATRYVDDIQSAIYIKDGAAAILKNRSKKSGCRLVSAIQDSWKKSIQLLGDRDLPERGESEVKNICPQGLQTIVVKPSSSVEEVLEMQRKA